jgi:Family of unknown function (DUF6683)
MTPTLRNITFAFLLLIGLGSFANPATAQIVGVEPKPIAPTWPKGVPALLEEVKKTRKIPRARRPPPKVSAVKFIPVPDSGMATALASALTQDPQQRAGLMVAFRQIKQAYEGEVSKDGKSNNLAAAFAFFISVNVMAYQQTDPPPEAAVEALFQELQSSMSGSPEFARLTNLEKQKIHDWLVYMGGFSMAGYTSARQEQNAESLRTFRELAGYSLRLVLGVDPATLSFNNNELSVGP